MFGEPIAPPIDRKMIILRPHWQYHIKRCGTRPARLCCNGSKYTAPLLHELALTYSLCVEHPIQQLFFAIAANLNLKVYRGDAKDALAHSPGPEMSTFLAIDDAYAKWYEQRLQERSTGHMYFQLSEPYKDTQNLEDFGRYISIKFSNHQS